MSSSFLDSMKVVASADDLKTVELPSGKYRMLVLAVGEKVLSSERKRFDTTYPEGHSYLMVTLKPVDVYDEVDEEELEECTDWKNKTINESYFSSDELKSSFFPLCAHAGIDLDEVIKETDGEPQAFIDALSKAILKKTIIAKVVRSEGEKGTFVNLRGTQEDE